LSVAITAATPMSRDIGTKKSNEENNALPVHLEIEKMKK